MKSNLTMEFEVIEIVGEDAVTSIGIIENNEYKVGSKYRITFPIQLVKIEEVATSKKGGK